jgi:hypothetical protein
LGHDQTLKDDDQFEKDFSRADLRTEHRQWWRWRMQGHSLERQGRWPVWARLQARRLASGGSRAMGADI